MTRLMRRASVLFTGLLTFVVPGLAEAQTVRIQTSLLTGEPRSDVRFLFDPRDVNDQALDPGIVAVRRVQDPADPTGVRAIPGLFELAANDARIVLLSVRAQGGIPTVDSEATLQNLRLTGQTVQIFLPRGSVAGPVQPVYPAVTYYYVPADKHLCPWFQRHRLGRAQSHR
jgi:hypothetical protein